MKPIYDSAGHPVRHYKRTTASRAPRAAPEAALQTQVAQFLMMTLPDDVYWTASLAGAHLGQSQRSKMKAQGLRPGWPDVQLCIRRRMYFLELKKPLDVKPRNPARLGTLDDPGLSDEQRAVLGALHPDCWRICRSVEQVRDALVAWGVVLRPHTLG